MPRYFTHYWTHETWKNNQRESEGDPLDHTAGNMFHRKGVKPGDFIYVVTVLKGQLLLAGRMQVDKIVSHTEAEAILECELWEASDHLIARRKACTLLRFDQKVPLAVTRRLRFKSPDGVKPALFAGGGLDRQTLRVIRELTPTSADALNRLL